ncbi:helix-turn-helix domain-containing GNAT family N-acetyltransferase [Streptomyces sp. DSM 44917]|uniref:Helix-turn-helix domain-containing GNAT family N-acetyltransferase n=1 Tax=Streptomyces boetiae TaxID=3075541 RepID=A0ABU2L7M7_9ACTN|nr:helix-turn-helix domain-containing GNAT family N-acetyltransferase [Streptomyces sp. DSM 44917]MDT0307564.1 helix-turn-helix domain-containing GNAT family N-acetyltransferase [Streptomyces sp. DSM 44917]
MNTVHTAARAAEGGDGTVARVRAFNRAWTRGIGALDYEHRLGTPHSLAEARVLYELAGRGRTPVAELRRRLEMDPGQLSRLLARAEEAGLVLRERDPGDARRQRVGLTGTGRRAAALLDARSESSVAAVLNGLGEEERAELTAALGRALRLLGLAERPSGFRLRPPGPGDLGWVVMRHGALYAREYGWGAPFEALVAGVVAEFARGHDPAREAAWIAEHDGAPAGCVFCVADEARPDTALLRLLLVEPSARGLGLGGALVEECVRFARAAGYARLSLWTNEVLASARRLYRAAGFTLTAERRHTLFGPEETGQTWELPLREG